VRHFREIPTIRSYKEIQVPQGPGTSVNLNEEAIEHYKV
jgi:hypothetical protein